MKARSVADLTTLTVLALLAERSCHPYEMQRLIRERRKDYLSGSPRSLYRAVERLERDGLIEPVETSRDGNRPERTVYRITIEGFERFQDQLIELLSVPAGDPPVFTAAVAFLVQMPVQVAERALRTRMVLLEGQIAQLQAQLSGLRERLHRLLLVELEYLLVLRRAELDWIRALSTDIVNGALSWDADALRSDPSRMLLPPPSEDCTGDAMT